MLLRIIFQFKVTLLVLLANLNSFFRNIFIFKFKWESWLVFVGIHFHNLLGKFRIRKCKQFLTFFPARNAGTSPRLRLPDLHLQLPLVLAREVLRQEQQGRRWRQLSGQQRDKWQHPHQRVKQEELGPLQEVVPWQKGLVRIQRRFGRKYFSHSTINMDNNESAIFLFTFKLERNQILYTHTHTTRLSNNQQFCVDSGHCRENFIAEMFLTKYQKYWKIRRKVKQRKKSSFLYIKTLVNLFDYQVDWLRNTF